MHIRKLFNRIPSFKFSFTTKMLTELGLDRKPILMMSHLNTFDPTSRFYTDRKVLEDLIAQYKDIKESLQAPGISPADADFFKNEEREIIEQLQNETDRLESLLMEDQFRSVDDTVDGALVEFRAGVGGEESHLFAEEMCHFYMAFMSSRGYNVQKKEVSSTSKTLSLKVSSNMAYKELKCEAGVHKVIRVPATETKGRLHSSTISIVVLPDVPFEFNLNEKELKLEYCRAQGPGGQHVNRTESACRVTHIPTGLQVLIQDSREQHKNRSRAIEVLRDRLYHLEFEKKCSEEKKNRKSQMGSGDRSDKIRTFNFQQDRITDHRLNKTAFGIARQMETHEFFEECIDEILKAERQEELKEFYDSLEARYLINN